MLDVQKLTERPSGEEQIGRHTRRIWKDARGDLRLEANSIDGMGHGVPLATTGVDFCGVTGPFFLEAGLCSTSQIARFWGLDTAESPGVAVGDTVRSWSQISCTKPSCIARRLLRTGR